MVNSNCFSPDFDLKKAKKRVAAAIASPASNLTGAKKVSFLFSSRSLLNEAEHDTLRWSFGRSECVWRRGTKERRKRCETRKSLFQLRKLQKCLSLLRMQSCSLLRKRMSNEKLADSQTDMQTHSTKEQEEVKREK